MKKTVIIAICAAAALSALILCGLSFKVRGEESEGAHVYGEEIRDRVKLFQEGEIPEPLEYSQRDNSLSRNGEDEGEIYADWVLYDMLYSGLADKNEVIFLYGYADDNYNYYINDTLFNTIYNCVLNENPEFFYVYSGYSYVLHSGTGDVFYVRPYYIVDGQVLDMYELRRPLTANEIASITAQQAVYEAALGEIVSQVNEGWSVQEKLLFVHDYMAVNFEYDLSLSIYDAYTFFTVKTGVCKAYTLAFQAVMKELEIPSSYATTPADGMNHIWNVVNVAGDWYHIDITWDDPVPDVPGKAEHKYFLISDGLIEASGHYGWFSQYGCDSHIYDNFFWRQSSAPFCYDEGNDTWYYIVKNTKRLNRANLKTMAYEAVLTLAGNWQKWGGGGLAWSGNYSSLAFSNGLLWLSAPDKILSYDPASGKLESVFLIDTASGYVYGFITEGGILTYSVATAPDAVPARQGSFSLAIQNGDINGDAKVNNKDVVYLEWLLAGWTGDYSAKTDFNSDGQLTLADSALLRRYLAGWAIS